MMYEILDGNSFGNFTFNGKVLLEDYTAMHRYTKVYKILLQIIILGQMSWNFSVILKLMI